MLFVCKPTLLSVGKREEFFDNLKVFIDKEDGRKSINMKSLIDNYKFEQKVNCSDEKFQVLIEVFPPIDVGINESMVNLPEKEIKASKIELIANSPNLNEDGGLSIKFIDEKGGEHSYGLKKLYLSPDELKKDLNRFLRNIKTAYMKGRGLGYDNLNEIESCVSEENNRLSIREG